MDCHEALEKAFVETFVDELLPGIFHNFANPLNGIMGRAKLMQRRLHDFVRTLEKRYPGIEQEMGPQYTKLLSDIDSINNESERFFNMFCVSTGKFYALGTKAVERLNLSRVIEAELDFADFYLDFKHHIKKEVILDPELPEVEGVTAHVSMAFWMILRVGMKRTREGNQESMRIATGYDDERITFSMSCPDGGSLKDALHQLQGLGGEGGPAREKIGREWSMVCAVLVLQRLFAGAEATYDEDGQQVVIRIPYQVRQGLKK